MVGYDRRDFYSKGKINGREALFKFNSSMFMMRFDNIFKALKYTNAHIKLQ